MSLVTITVYRCDVCARTAEPARIDGEARLPEGWVAVVNAGERWDPSVALTVCSAHCLTTVVGVATAPVATPAATPDAAATPTAPAASPTPVAVPDVAPDLAPDAAAPLAAAPPPTVQRIVGRPKLSEAEVTAIRDRFTRWTGSLEAFCQAEARTLPVTPQAIRYLIEGETWQSLPERYGSLTAADVERLRREFHQLKAGVSHKQFYYLKAREHGVTPSAIRNIVQRRNIQHVLQALAG